MTETEDKAREIARVQGHKNVDETIVCTDGAKVPVWKFYLDAAAVTLAALPPADGGPP